MKKSWVSIFIITVLLLLQKVRAADQKPYMFFDFGMTVVMTVTDPKTDDFSEIFYMPGALHYLRSLRAAGYHLGLLVNVPDEWGATTTIKVDKIKSYVAQRWTDSEPMDWSLFDAGVLVPPKDELRKPFPFLFNLATKMASDKGASAIFQGEDVREIATATAAGMLARQVHDGSDFFLAIDQIPTFRGQQTKEMNVLSMAKQCVKFFNGTLH